MEIRLGRHGRHVAIVTIGAIGSIQCAATAADAHNALAMLVRREGETLNALLKRLDKAIASSTRTERSSTRTKQCSIWRPGWRLA